MLSRHKVRSAPAVVIISILLLCTVAVVWTSAHGQMQVGSEGQSAQELRTEVRLLRGEVQGLKLALQRFQQGLLQTQLTLDQRRIQQEQVHFLRQALEQTRQTTASLAQEKTQLQESLDEAERQLAAAPDAALRAQLGQEVRDHQEALNQRTQAESQERVKEAQLAAELEREQSRPAELSERLAALVSALEPKPGQPRQ